MIHLGGSRQIEDVLRSPGSGDTIWHRRMTQLKTAASLCRYGCTITLRLVATGHCKDRQLTRGQDIEPEEAGHSRRRARDPWAKPESDEIVTFDVNIFSKDHPMTAKPDRPVSPGGRCEVDLTVPPLPWGAESWEEVQGRATRQTMWDMMVREAKCFVSRAAYTPVGLYVRDRVGRLVDDRGISWPASYRFTKANDQWTCQ